MFLITAHPRSGTLYTATIFQKLGYKVSHEWENEDGTVSWKHLFQSEKFNPVIHQVRHPLNVISSTHTINKVSFKKMLSEINYKGEIKNKTHKAMITYYFWNIEANKRCSWRFKIEELGNIYPELFKLLDLQVPKELPQVNKNKHSRKHIKKYKKVSWNDLFKIDEGLTNKIIKLGGRYGYNAARL